MNRITRDVIDAKLARVNFCVDYYNSNIEKIKVCKGNGGYSIEAVIDGNQIDHGKMLTAKEVCKMLDVLYVVLDGHCIDPCEMYSQKEENTKFILRLIQTMNYGI